jgi:hypothetical protein
VVAKKVLERGAISLRGPDTERSLFREHRHLSRQEKRFANKGGTVHVQEGPVEGELADAFVSCCTDSYSRHAHPGRSINVEGYGDYVRDFLVSFPETLHIYARMNGNILGVQTFIRHDNHLELTEGGFSSTDKTYHAYENIILASVRYGLEKGLDRVSYGLVTNPAKDRLMDREGREPVFLVMFFRSRITSILSGMFRGSAHKRFPLSYWRERGKFENLPV